MQCRTAVVNDCLRQIRPMCQSIAKEVQDVTPGYSQYTEARHILKAHLPKFFFCITHVTLPYVPSPNLLNFTPCWPPPLPIAAKPTSPKGASSGTVTLSLA
jgi:hypothetical protein